MVSALGGGEKDMMHDTTTHPLRILIADDHPMMLMGIRALLSTRGRYEIVGEASTAEDAIELARKLHPDIAVMDISLPGMNGLDAAAVLRRETPDVKVVILSMYEDHEYVLQFVRCGASAYVIKNNSPQELLSAIDAVAKGQAYFSPSVAGMILREQQGAAKQDSPALNERERQVLVHLARGMTTKQIAETLYISSRTVQKHRENIMAKLGLHSVADLTRWAIARKLIELDGR
jgi:DNA-binding NarL/FixJ family response regulator